MTNSLLPYMEVHGPDSQEFTVALKDKRLTIGRFQQFNDVALEPDPQQLIGRKVHCSIEYSEDRWWVVDNGSVNKTFLRHGEVIKIVDGRAPIGDGEVVRILGKLSESGDPQYWELVFRDPMRTHPAIAGPEIAYLEYDWIQAKLFRVGRAQRLEISNLPPQQHKLIRYMDQRNRANGNVPVMCTYEELIAAVWGEGEDAFGHTEAEVNRLIWELRQKFEPDPNQPRFLELVRGLGYRLVTMTRVTPQAATPTTPLTG